VQRPAKDLDASFKLNRKKRRLKKSASRSFTKSKKLRKREKKRMPRD
jgi:hypothetical protein